MSSGDVSKRTRMTFSFLLVAHSVASSAVKTTFPQAAPGDAARAIAIGLAFLSAITSNCGCKRASSCLGSIMHTASFSLIIPSSTKSQAILRAAAAVRLPLRVCSI